AGSEVRVSRARRGAEELANADTDEDGTFAVVIAPGGGEIDAVASAPGFVSAGWRGRAGADPVAITLKRAAVLIGRVVRADTGEAVPSAVVHHGGYADRDPVRADHEGRFRFDRARPGSFRPVARAPGLLGYAPTNLWLAAGETSAEILVALHP